MTRGGEPYDNKKTRQFNEAINLFCSIALSLFVGCRLAWVCVIPFVFLLGNKPFVGLVTLSFHCQYTYTHIHIRIDLMLLY